MNYTESQIETLLRASLQAGVIASNVYMDILKSANKLRTDNLKVKLQAFEMAIEEEVVVVSLVSDRRR